MWNSLSSVSRLLLRWAIMLVQVTPIAVTAPVMMLGTTMTHQFTSTSAPYPVNSLVTDGRRPWLGFTLSDIGQEYPRAVLPDGLPAEWHP